MQGSFLDQRDNIFEAEYVLAGILAATCAHVDHSGIDDHSILAVQHGLSVVFNDRDPNQRSAAANGWGFLLKSSLLSYFSQGDTMTIRKHFIAFLLCLDSKNYTRLVNKMLAAECPDPLKVRMF